MMCAEMSKSYRESGETARLVFFPEMLALPLLVVFQLGSPVPGSLISNAPQISASPFHMPGPPYVSS